MGPLPVRLTHLRVAAIDIGSNSIRQLVADVDPLGGLQPVHESRQVVRLGEGVFRGGALESTAMDHACDVLEEMSFAARHLDVVALRAVGTAALREATNSPVFVPRASAIIGVPLEVISGDEESRLVQRAVARTGRRSEEPTLVVDVGGGSAQLIVSEPASVVSAWSLPLGAVRLTSMFLRTDRPTPSDVTRLVAHVRAHLDAPLRQVRRAGVSRMVATSATAGALVCAARGIKRSLRHEANGETATVAEVRELFERLARTDSAGRAAMPGIGGRRAEIIVAGAVVIREVLSGVGLPGLEYSTAGVREGVVFDLADALLQARPVVCSLGRSAAVA
jgi:exopolyphosphatase/guanosine-5'-triphosphate,3'-diphosphate pyrophosphatase